MKIIVISDTHNKHHNINMPDGDMIICAGDITNCGNIKDVISFKNWINKFNHKYKVVIAGNHDFCFEKNRSLCVSVLDDIIYLEDQLITIEGINIYGSPWQPRFFDWAFNLDRGEPLKKVWEKIPEFTDILITHGPPKDILDKCERDNRVGCEELIKVINKIKPKYHIFGHIHEGYGIIKNNDTTFINASICDYRYNPINQPIIIDI